MKRYNGYKLTSSRKAFVGQKRKGMRFRNEGDRDKLLHDFTRLSFFTVEQAAEALSQPVKTVYYWLEQGLIPFHRFGKRKGIRISHHDLKKFVESRQETALSVPDLRL
jgi:excisionase family DNA binding protein